MRTCQVEIQQSLHGVTKTSHQCWRSWHHSVDYSRFCN